MYWSGWKTVSWLLGSQLVMFLIYLCFSKYTPKEDVSLAQQLKSAWWLIGFYIMMLIFSYIGSFGHGLGIQQSRRSHFSRDRLTCDLLLGKVYRAPKSRH